MHISILQIQQTEIDTLQKTSSKKTEREKKPNSGKSEEKYKDKKEKNRQEPVSYTHLTLPTTPYV